MNFEDISWSAFRKTGDIDAYLLHIEVETVRKEKWKVSRLEESWQGELTTEKPTVF